MNIHFLAKNFDPREDQKAYVIEKVEKLKKYGERIADESTQAKVEVEKDLKQSSGELISLKVTLFVPGDTLRAEVQATTVEEAMDLAYEKLKSQALAYKAKTEHVPHDDALGNVPSQEKDEFNF